MEPKKQGKWIEWVLSREILCRRAIDGKDLFEPLKFWQTKEHEIDFYEDSLGVIESKRGQASAGEFSFFFRTFPNKSLNLISKTSYKTAFLQAVTLEAFLLGEISISSYSVDGA